MYVLCGRKGKGARGNSFVSANYSYAYVHTASLSKNRSVAPQSHQNIFRGEIFQQLSQTISCVVHPKRKSILNFENPLFLFPSDHIVLLLRMTWTWLGSLCYASRLFPPCLVHRATIHGGISSSSSAHLFALLHRMVQCETCVFLHYPWVDCWPE